MFRHADQEDKELRRLIDDGAINVGGNERLKIFGTLDCRSGMRMSRGNRVFFRDRSEAEAAGFRPCGKCMRNAYIEWRKLNA